jgi:hypothetical protein
VKLFKGKAQCLSSDKFSHMVLAVEEGRKTKAAGKERMKLDRERKSKWFLQNLNHLCAREFTHWRQVPWPWVHGI